MLWKPESVEAIKDQPSDEPILEEQTSDEPAAMTRVSDKAALVDQVHDEPVPQEWMPDELGAEEQVSDEPILVEYVSEEPVAEERVFDEPIAMEQASDEPAPAERVSGELGTQEWVAEIVALTVAGRNQMDRIETRLDALVSWPEQLERRLVEARAETVALREDMQDLRQEMKRVGRHQFKSNALDEARLERWAEALKALETTLARREGEVASIHLQQRQAIESARREWLAELLPLLDGLEDALVSGETQITWLKGKRTAWEMEQSQRQGVLDRLRRVWRGDGPAATHGSLAALSGWLEGLRLLRDRAWTLLQDAGVQVIPAVGRPFDPHLHVAVDAVERENVPHGFIVSEQRCGYRLNDNVLRFAEVVVAHCPVVLEISGDQDAQSEISDSLSSSRV